MNHSRGAFGAFLPQHREVVAVITTIRRKFILGLVLVGSLLAVNVGSGCVSLFYYHCVIRDLDFAINRAPHQPDVVAAIGEMFEPLLLHVRNDAGARFQQQQFVDKLRRAQDQILDFRRRLEDMPSEVMSGRKPVTDTLLSQLDQGLSGLAYLQRDLVDPKLRAQKQETMHHEVARLQLLAMKVPDPVQGLSRELAQARAVFRDTYRIVVTVTLLGVALTFALFWYGYWWIFDPIHKLHAGARRVAQGDFSYRLELNTRDEMSELAESFNSMSQSFQEIRSDLDGQVRERSRQLVRSERLAGLGVLAAGVAHEINNPLFAILTAADSIEERLQEALPNINPGDGKVMTSYLKMMKRETERCRTITSKLLDFARGQDATRARTNVTELMTEVLELVQHLGKYKTQKIEFDHQAACQLVVNGPEIKQVLLNLVTNALESMESDGTLNIELREQTDDVVIAFHDTGCGMTPEVVENLFEPFFTRRKDGQGTGLGLSISHRIITEHGGTIDAHSDGPGCGSTIAIRLPRQVPQQVTAA